MSKIKLFDNSDDDEGDLELKTNVNFAKSYTQLKKKDLSEKCK